MKESPAQIGREVRSVSRRQYMRSVRAQTWSVAADRWAFFCLVGFIATQGFLVPLFPLPVNWAIWPSLPDIFGIGLLLAVLVNRQRSKLTAFDRGMLVDLLWMGGVFVVNFLFVTIPMSRTGEGIKFGGFTLIVFAKLLAVYWAAAHVRIDPKRTHVLHVAALIALLWLTGVVLADRYFLIEIDRFAMHLPRAAAGKWGVSNLASTVSQSHGGTTVVILLLSALAISTARHRLAWLVEGVVLVMAGSSVFLAGSRQGLVRITTFIMVYAARKPLKYFLLASFWLLFVIIAFFWLDTPLPSENMYYLQALERQQVLLSDPFSNEGLSGRPELWFSVISTLDESLPRWIVGYGMGNYVEYRNSAHNMFLQFIQDGGILELIVMCVLWTRILSRIWRARREAWILVAVTFSMLTSVFTSAIFYPNLSTGWYLGLYFVIMHIALGVGVDER